MHAAGPCKRGVDDSIASWTAHRRDRRLARRFAPEARGVREVTVSDLAEASRREAPDGRGRAWAPSASGYVGLPLSVEFAERAACGSPASTCRTRRSRPSTAASPTSRTCPRSGLAALVDARAGCGASRDFDRLARVRRRRSSACRRRSARPRTPTSRWWWTPRAAIAARLRPGQLVVLESTTYPGTTEELILPHADGAGPRRSGSRSSWPSRPERVDPGNARFDTRNTPKIIGGVTAACTRVAQALYAPGHRHRDPGLLHPAPRRW